MKLSMALLRPFFAILVLLTLLAPALTPGAAFGQITATTPPPITTAQAYIAPIGMNTWPYYINDQGVVTGGLHIGAAPAQSNHAFVWSPSTANALTGTLVDDGTGGGLSAIGYFLDLNGYVYGKMSDFDSEGCCCDYLYSTNPAISLTPVSGVFRSISDTGRGPFVGWTRPNGADIATIFDQATLAATPIGSLLGQDQSSNYLGESQAFSINIDKDAVGWSIAKDGFKHAVEWTPSLPDYHLLDWGTLGGHNSYATAINDHGIGVGYSEVAPNLFDTTGHTIVHAFIKAPTVKMTDMVPGAPVTYKALAINNNGLIGGELDAFGTKQAFFAQYPNDTSPFPLMQYVVNGTGWSSLDSVCGINSRNEMVGFGVYNGMPTGWVALFLAPDDITPQNSVLASGATEKFTVTLGMPAPSPTDVQLLYFGPMSGPSTLPFTTGQQKASVTVACGTTPYVIEGTFEAEMSPVSAISKFTLTPGPGGYATRISVTDDTVTAGVGSPGLVSISQPGGASGGTQVTFTSSDTNVIPAPGPVTIYQGAHGVAFTFDSILDSVTLPTKVTLTATANGASVSITITVNP